MSRSLRVYRAGGIGDTLALTPFLAGMRERYAEIVLVGNAERLALIDPRLYDRVLSYDAPHDGDSVAFSKVDRPGYRIRYDPFPPPGENIYDYMARLAGVTAYVPPPSEGRGQVIHPGSGSKTKNAPLEFFLERAEPDAIFVLGPAEPQAWKGQRPSTLAELKSIIASRARFLGNDSGPAHIAALAGLETTIVYTSSDPVVWKPPGRVGVVNLK